jgi:hypothetical protein
MTASNRQSQSSTGFPGARTIDRLSEQIKFGHEAWVERLREMQDVEAAYTKELLAARDPNESLKICNRWIGKRLELLTADSKAFTGFWMDLVMTAAGGAQRVTVPPQKSEDA